MKINVYVKRKVGSPSAQTTVFNTEDKNLTEELTKLRRDIIDDFSEKDDKECITVSCSLRPDFLITLDSEVSAEDADTILNLFFKEIQNRAICENNRRLFNYAPPHPIIPTYIGNGIGPQYNPANTVPYLNGFPFYYGFPIYNQSPCGETIKKHQEKDSDSTKKNKNLKSEETIGDEYLEKLMSAFNDFVSIVNDIYDEYKEVKELDEY